jgi:TctA family transporter
MTGQRKLVGLALCLGAVVAVALLVPDALAAATSIATLYGLFVAGNYGEHKAREP